MPEAQSQVASIPEASQVNRRFAGVGAAMGLVVWITLFQIPLGIASFIVGKSHPRLGLMLGFLAMLSVIPGVLWVARSAWGEHWRRALPLAPVGAAILVWTTLCVLASIPLKLAWFLVLERTIGLPDLPDPMSSVGVLGVLLGAPIAEEILFRGYGLARIRELGGPWRALLFTAVVFALVHSWAKWPIIFLDGLFWGWLVLRTGSLWPAFMGHFINNGTVIVFERWGPIPLSDPRQASWAVILALGAASLAGLALLWSPPVRRRISGLLSPSI
jgi:membrane protease YdiL (CAAX protease family)